MYILRGHRYSSKQKIIFLSLKINVILENSVDPAEMALSVAFHIWFSLFEKAPI